MEIVNNFIVACDELTRFEPYLCDVSNESEVAAVYKTELNDLWSKVKSTYETALAVEEYEEDSDQKETESKERKKKSSSARIKETIRVKYRNTLKLYAKCASILAEKVNSKPVNTSEVNHKDDSVDRIRLPACDIEPFDGDYLSWPTFRDSFTVLIVDNSKVSPVEKLFILVQKTRNEAHEIVSEAPKTHDGFEIAWNALCERFDNKRMLVNRQFKALFNLISVKEESAVEIRRLHRSIHYSASTLDFYKIDATLRWDALLVYLCSMHLPAETLGLWEQSLKNSREIPKWSDLVTFLAGRCDSLDSIGDVQISPPSNSRRQPMAAISIGKGQKRIFSNHVTTVGISCNLCKNQEHTIRNCKKFQKMSVSERKKVIMENRLCLNCFAKNHSVRDCSSTHNCFKCGKRHHTLLHRNMSDNEAPTTSAKASQFLQAKQSAQVAQSTLSNLNRVTNCCATSSNIKTVLLGTAMVHIHYLGNKYMVRALIDSGSQATLISENLTKRLNLHSNRSELSVLGVNDVVTAKTQRCVSFFLGSPINPYFQIDIDALVVPKLISKLPLVDIDSSLFKDLPKMTLADPNFFTSSQIDLLIGADLFPSLLKEGNTTKVLGSLVAQETIFGWILTGPLPETTRSNVHIISCFNEISLDEQLTRFWEVEEIPKLNWKSEEDKYCEELFARTIKRDADGRYIVQLPFKRNFLSNIRLGPSRSRAMSQYLRNEARLQRKPELKSQYDDVLREYIQLGHMVLLNSYKTSHEGYYLPHHAVIKNESITTKLRVVFNASSASMNGISLNDVLYTGPTLQLDLTLLLLRWRFFKYVFNSDIRQMYRQILVDPAHTPFQRILYRDTPGCPLQDYELKTVTFGLNCAPYLAIRTLLQLADDVNEMFPLASSILRESVYVDDILAGFHDISTSLQAREQIITALNSAGFELRKWASNSVEILHQIPKDHLLSENFLHFSDPSTAKTLGVRWHALSDRFFFSVIPWESNESCTKRQLLSQVAKLFDPAGWLAPCVIVAKILIQTVWKEKIGWDEEVPKTIIDKWHSFQLDMNRVTEIYIPRWVHFHPENEFEYHIFCDASEKAYAAAIYIRVVEPNRIRVSLLTAKTRVAPVKTVSLPRLELCGAALAADLIEFVVSNLPFKANKLQCWTDSTIVLAWLQKEPSHWHTFVGNRIARLQKVTSPSDWHHVASHDNPADLASRGASPLELTQNKLWWEGPTWLSQPSELWPRTILNRVSETTGEERKVRVCFSYFKEFEDILLRFSSWARALRVLVYVFRFIKRCHPRFSTLTFIEEISREEITEVKERLIQVCQKAAFPTEYHALQNKKEIPSNSSLTNVNPIIDAHLILRVCGRLSEAPEWSSYEQSPIILPYNCQFTKLLIKFIHEITLHGGNQLVLRILRSQFWVPRVRRLIKATILSCKVCVIYRHKTREQIMGLLPATRIVFSRPFTHTGVDFAGPFEIRSFSGRACRITKGYVCVFVCFSTKAIHLEVTSDLTTTVFLAAFQRFVGRRGCPSCIYSDNGKTFVGAAKEITRDFLEASRSAAIHHFESQSLGWNFIPPGAPHMGGLWEAGVKSFKSHFRKSAGLLRFTFEEFSTLLCRVEACLNSRPLTPISEDPTDLVALTPGHFLIGAPLLAPAESPEEREPISIVNRWQKVKAIHHQFCTRWKHEYVMELHKRNKWQRPHPDLIEGTMVVVKEDNLPPTEWRLGRVRKVYTGSDKRVRVADVLTNRGLITRPIVKLVVLPTEMSTN